MTAVSEPEEFVRKTKDWIKSSLGKQRLVEIRKSARSTKTRLSKVRKVDPKSLKKPISR